MFCRCEDTQSHFDPACSVTSKNNTRESFLLQSLDRILLFKYGHMCLSCLTTAVLIADRMGQLWNIFFSLGDDTLFSSRCLLPNIRPSETLRLCYW